MIIHCSKQTKVADMFKGYSTLCSIIGYSLSRLDEDEVSDLNMLKIEDNYFKISKDHVKLGIYDF